jgi:hypothetical protein
VPQGAEPGRQFGRDTRADDTDEQPHETHECDAEATNADKFDIVTYLRVFDLAIPTLVLYRFGHLGNLTANLLAQLVLLDLQFRDAALRRRDTFRDRGVRTRAENDPCLGPYGHNLTDARAQYPRSWATEGTAELAEPVCDNAAQGRLPKVLAQFAEPHPAKEEAEHL